MAPTERTEKLARLVLAGKADTGEAKELALKLDDQTRRICFLEQRLEQASPGENKNDALAVQRVQSGMIEVP